MYIVLLFSIHTSNFYSNKNIKQTAEKQKKYKKLKQNICYKYTQLTLL